MAQNIGTHIGKCKRYLHFKHKSHKTEFSAIIATHPLELEHIDLLTIEPGETNKVVNIFVIIDHFTLYAQAFITPS